VDDAAKLRKNGGVAERAWKQRRESKRLRKRSDEAMHRSSNGSAAGVQRWRDAALSRVREPSLQHK